jgi:hypothetical protein
MAGVLPHIGNVTLLDCNIRTGDDLPGLDGYPAAIADDQVRRKAAHGDIDECAGEFRRRWHSVSVEWFKVECKRLIVLSKLIV